MNKMILFRVDSSIEIGSGHVMRCLTLANKLRKSGAEVQFISRELPGNLNEYIESKGFNVNQLSEVPIQFVSNEVASFRSQADVQATIAILEKVLFNIDWIIIDHYGIDKKWEMQIRPFVKNIMVIDDLANRYHDCDLLLDQNHYNYPNERYQGLVPAYCKKFLGPKYALLRDEFRKAKKNLEKRDGYIRRILVSFGGSDPTNETFKTIEALHLIPRLNVIVDIVVGSGNQNKHLIEETCRKIPWMNYYCQVDHMAELMAKADLSIGAGGASNWERCYLGLPTIVIIVAQNQEETTLALADLGAIWCLGWYHEVDSHIIAKAILRAMADATETLNMKQRMLRLMDGENNEEENEILKILTEACYANS